MSRQTLKRPRFVQRIRAFLSGLYWAECLICCRWYGGHETADQPLLTGYGGGQSVCVECGPEAKRRNQAVNYFIPASIQVEARAVRPASPTSCPICGLTPLRSHVCGSDEPVRWMRGLP